MGRYLMATLGALATLVAAQEDLYGPATPIDIAYVRVLHAAPGYSAFQAASGELLFEAIDLLEVTPYYPFPPGRLNISLPDVVSNLTVSAGGFYTVAFLPGTSRLFRDTPLIDSSRALLAFYNLTERLVGLRTADGVSVMPEVAPHSAESLVVSEAEVGLAAFDADSETLLAEVAPQRFSRGVAHSLFLLETPESFQLSYAPAALGTVP